MHRGLTALRSALLVLLIGAALPLAVGSVAAGSVNPPGQISVTPQSIVEGTTGNKIGLFTYISTVHQWSTELSRSGSRGAGRFPNFGPLEPAEVSKRTTAK